MKKYIFEITVDTNNELNDANIEHIIKNFKARLEGYTTQCPLELVPSSISLQYKGVISNIKNK